MRYLCAIIVLGVFAHALPQIAIGKEAAPHETHDAHDDDTHGAAGGDSGGTKEPTNPVPWDPDLAIFTGIIFLVLMAILYFTAWGPILAGLEKRESGIAEDIAAAEESNRKAQELLQEYEKRLASASEEVREMLDSAKREAEEQKQKAVAETERMTSAVKDKAVREIDAAKQQALGELAQQSVTTAVGLAGSILRRELRPDDHSQLIQESLDKFSSQN